MKPKTAPVVSVLPALAPHGASGWRLVWSDEFDAPANSSPDLYKWTYDLGGGGWGNQELETYTDDPNNVFQDGQGHLVIRAIKTGSGSYTSARLKTQNRFTVQYGRIEARIQIPRGQGVWPAFWMLGEDVVTAGWPNCGEIDIMEVIGRQPTLVHGTVHGPGYSGASGITAQYALPGAPPLAEGFHIYSIEWSPGLIRFFLDGASYAEVTPASLPRRAAWVYDRPFFLLLNLAVGGGWPGNPDQTTAFPQEMCIDWVRVWQPSE